jgi:hypothetical protein
VADDLSSLHSFANFASPLDFHHAIIFVAGAGRAIRTGRWRVDAYGGASAPLSEHAAHCV